MEEKIIILGPHPVSNELLVLIAGPHVGGDYGPYIQSQRLHHYSSTIQKLLEVSPFSSKLECLVALCRALLHPQLIEETFGVNIFFEHSGWHETSRNARDGQTTGRTTSQSDKKSHSLQQQGATKNKALEMSSPVLGCAHQTRIDIRPK